MRKRLATISFATVRLFLPICPVFDTPRPRVVWLIRESVLFNQSTRRRGSDDQLPTVGRDAESTIPTTIVAEVFEVTPGPVS